VFQSVSAVCHDNVPTSDKAAGYQKLHRPAHCSMGGMDFVFGGWAEGKQPNNCMPPRLINKKPLGRQLLWIMKTVSR
jgi:hypothetical protein